MTKIRYQLKYLLFSRPEFVFVLVMALVALSIIFSRDSDHGTPPKRETLSTKVTSEKSPVGNRDSSEKNDRMPDVITRSASVKAKGIRDVALKNHGREALGIQSQPAFRESLIEELVDRCLEETDATNVEIVEKGRMNFTVARLTNRAAITMEELAGRYFEMFPDEKQIVVSVLDGNGEVAGRRVYPRRFSGM